MFKRKREENPEINFPQGNIFVEFFLKWFYKMISIVLAREQLIYPLKLFFLFLKSCRNIVPAALQKFVGIRV